MLKFYYKKNFFFINFEKKTSFDGPKTLNFHFFWVSIFGIGQNITQYSKTPLPHYSLLAYSTEKDGGDSARQKSF